jgi:hypothetical protein
MLITRLCPFSAKENTREIGVTEEQLSLWIAGIPIQKAMSNLSTDDREFIMTGITPEMWEDAFRG